MSVKSESIKTMRGGQRFLSDMPFPRLLETRVLTAGTAKGRFTVTALPLLRDGRAVFFASDIPGLNTITRGRGDLPLLAPGRIRYRGEPIGIAAAETSAALDELCRHILIEFEEETPLFGLEDAGADRAAGDRLSYREGKIAWGRGRRPAVSSEYTAAFQEFDYPEPPSAVALEEKGLLTVYCATRNPFHVRDNISLVLGLPAERLNLVVPDSVEDPGDKETLPAVLASLAALVAYKTGRPARVALDNTIKRRAAVIRLASALSPDGKLAGTTAELVMDAGCCVLRSPDLFRRAVYTLPGPYRHNGLTLQARALLTDAMPYSRLLAGGTTESCFAIEMHMTRLARAADLDPFTFRKVNLAVIRPAGSDETAPSAAERVIDDVMRRADFKRKFAAFEAFRRGADDGGPMNLDIKTHARGIGSALACYGFDFIEESEEREQHAITLTFERDGTLRILTSALETSQALRRLFTTIAARTLEIDPEDVVIEGTDTAFVPDSGPMYETHALTSIGKLIEQACRSLKVKRGRTKRTVSVTRTDASPASLRRRRRPVFHPSDMGALSWCATALELEIDPAVFSVTVRGIWATIECGSILNHDIAVAQAEREIVRAWDAVEAAAGGGHKLRFRKQRPDIEVNFIEIPYPRGPLGAKGIGELPGLGIAPAYAAAVSQALGRDIDFFPISPPSLEALIRGEGERT